MYYPEPIVLVALQSFEFLVSQQHTRVSHKRGERWVCSQQRLFCIYNGEVVGTVEKGYFMSLCDTMKLLTSNNTPLETMINIWIDLYEMYLFLLFYIQMRLNRLTELNKAVLKTKVFWYCRRSGAKVDMKVQSWLLSSWVGCNTTLISKTVPESRTLTQQKGLNHELVRDEKEFSLTLRL